LPMPEIKSLSPGHAVSSLFTVLSKRAHSNKKKKLIFTHVPGHANWNLVIIRFQNLNLYSAGYMRLSCTHRIQ